MSSSSSYTNNDRNTTPHLSAGWEGFCHLECVNEIQTTATSRSRQIVVHGTLYMLLNVCSRSFSAVVSLIGNQNPPVCWLFLVITVSLSARARERDRQRDRQTDRQTERDRDRETETDRETDGQTDRQTQTDRRTDRGERGINKHTDRGERGGEKETGKGGSETDVRRGGREEKTRTRKHKH